MAISQSPLLPVTIAIEAHYTLLFLNHTFVMDVKFWAELQITNDLNASSAKSYENHIFLKKSMTPLSCFFVN